MTLEDLKRLVEKATREVFIAPTYKENGMRKADEKTPLGIVDADLLLEAIDAEIKAEEARDLKTFAEQNLSCPTDGSCEACQ